MIKLNPSVTITFHLFDLYVANYLFQYSSLSEI